MVFKSDKDYVTEKIYVLNDFQLFEWLLGKNRLSIISDNSVYSSSLYPLNIHPKGNIESYAVFPAHGFSISSGVPMAPPFLLY